MGMLVIAQAFRSGRTCAKISAHRSRGLELGSRDVPGLFTNAAGDALTQYRPAASTPVRQIQPGRLNLEFYLLNLIHGRVNLILHQMQSTANRLIKILTAVALL